jgi:hypothetical protein
LSYETAAAIALVVVCLVLILMTYCCYNSCRSNGAYRVTHDAVRREPVVCTVAQVSGPDYHEVPVAVAFVHEHGSPQMV